MRNAIITVAGTILVPVLLFILIPYMILRAAPVALGAGIGVVEVASVALAVAGFTMILWVSTTFVRRGKGTPVPLDPPKEFIAIGLYRFVRNPMYLGLLLVMLAEAALFRSVWLLVYASLFWLAVHSYLILIEEPELEARFGPAYLSYKATTPRWIPRVPRRPGA